MNNSIQLFVGFNFSSVDGHEFLMFITAELSNAINTFRREDKN